MKKLKKLCVYDCACVWYQEREKERERDNHWEDLMKFSV